MPTPPKVLTDVGYEIYCDVQKLWELDVPAVDFPLMDLAWNFDHPFWNMDGTVDWNLTPRAVIENVAGSSGHR
ncbi:MAG: hypothetical protein KBD66_03725 [Candidatus Doudnabacteria bacterium]|nr:hypothetical protein [Candidatus Doudnabacteria bacterium]